VSLKQFVEQKYCLSCQGCCRFQDANSIWILRLFNQERRRLKLEKNTLTPIKYKDIFFCPYFNQTKNYCKIYRKRPLDCQLYPILLNRDKNKIFLVVDNKCSFIKDKKQTKKFKKYIHYLTRVLQSKKFIKKISKNYDFITTYPSDVAEIIELKKLSSLFHGAKPSSA